MATPDVTIMGAGIFGLSIAFACARRGAAVRVVERRGVGAGSSGGVVGALAPHTPENWNPKKQFQFESLTMAQSFFAEVDALSGRSSGYARLGRVQAVENARGLELAQARIAGARAHWAEAYQWQVLQSCGDWGPQSPTGHWVHDTLSGRIHPMMACQSLAAAVAALGSQIAQGDEAPDGTPVIWATGAEGLDALSHEIGKQVGNGVKGQALTLGFERPDAPQIFADGVHIVPHQNGTVAIGSTSERAFDDPVATDAQLDALHAKALAKCPVLRDAPVVQRWAGVRPRARSRAPMLGNWPGRPGHFVANGGFKIGFGMAPKVAEVMADLVLEGRDAIPNGFRVEDSL
ncbi:Oxidoreductase, FAD-binding [Candidatus Rhodobacter oscarellae]|uniref:Oxidoreductase, FAD-binding n=1 Tax=Candidatus Rhodobacter oscarellae TaxID=1675527 RepID=A0A0J9EAK2_9RHOB|nr:FAD-binding oxidoreductase [Candidatus Rhodobacter lobularis]KMW59636.1 Oxidoreductase, FAD-binding [Candidatus Rhodobacter lobularis]